jgi:putative transposase
VMRVALFVHVVWGTWDRLPLLSGETKRHVYRALEAKCVELGVEILALGGVEDHVHLLACIPATLAGSDLVKHLKGSSAHLATLDIAPGACFKWQGAYAAFAVGLVQLATLRTHIHRQKEHHAVNRLIRDWEEDDDVEDSATPSGMT